MDGRRRFFTLGSAEAGSFWQLVPMYLPSAALETTVKAQVVVGLWRHWENTGGDSLTVLGEKTESILPTLTALPWTRGERHHHSITRPETQ